MISSFGYDDLGLNCLDVFSLEVKGLEVFGRTLLDTSNSNFYLADRLRVRAEATLLRSVYVLSFSL